MKKLLLTSAVVLLAFIGMQAQPDATIKNDSKPAKEERKEARKEKRDERGNEINYQSKESFYRTYGDVADVTWTKGKHFDQALFNDNGIATTAYFDLEGELVGTTALKTVADLPASAQNQINKLYKGYTVENVLFFDDNEAVDTDMILYGNAFEDEDNYFVELKKDNKIIVVQVNMDGRIGLFAS
jgi:uncharacterized protein YxeA